MSRKVIRLHLLTSAVTGKAAVFLQSMKKSAGEILGSLYIQDGTGVSFKVAAQNKYSSNQELYDDKNRSRTKQCKTKIIS